MNILFYVCLIARAKIDFFIEKKKGKYIYSNISQYFGIKNNFLSVHKVHGESESCVISPDGDDDRDDEDDDDDFLALKSLM